MTFRKHVMITIVLLSISGLLLGCSEDSTVAPNTTYEAPPAAPAGLIARVNSDGFVVLMWQANTQPNIRGYNVYRHLVSESAIARLNNQPLPDSKYIDYNVNSGRQYEYMVTSVTDRGTESAYSIVRVNTSFGDKGVNFDTQ